MKQLLAVTLASALLVIGCEQAASPPSENKTRAEGEARKGRSRALGRATDIYAAVIRQMVNEERWLERLYVVNGPVGEAEDVRIRLRAPHERFPTELQQALAKRLDDLPLHFISHPDEALQGGAGKVKHDGGIFMLSEIVRRGPKVHVGNSIWCGSLCARSQTYVLKREGEAWRVTGTHGPIVIS